MNNTIRFWIRISFINLLVVGTLGVILRYKIAFPLPFIDQKHFLHGHSHFAFAGWISQVLMVLMVQSISRSLPSTTIDKYTIPFWGNLICAYGMLIAFPIQGYGFISISFSTLSIINLYYFGTLLWKDMNRIPLKLNSFLWFKAGLVFNVISSIGAFLLAYLMATKSIHQNNYLLSVYGFLHFQYNGWFFFVCMGLLMGLLENLFPQEKKFTLIFWLFALACIPSYFLSVLWLPMSLTMYILIILSAFAQLIAWMILIKFVFKQYSILQSILSKNSKWILALSAIALSIKLLLQLLSTIPSLSQISFGFRPIVIGYLHLVLLGVISLFIIGYILSNDLIKTNHFIHKGLLLFVAGIIVNELLLMLQGIMSMGYVSIPYINEFLLLAALIMFTGLVLLNYGINKK